MKISKANRTYSFLRRNLGNCPEAVTNTACKALVRLDVGYASSVCDPHLKEHKMNIEAVQRRAARFVEKYYRNREPGCLTKLSNNLDWQTLQKRRKNSHS